MVGSGVGDGSDESSPPLHAGKSITKKRDKTGMKVLCAGRVGRSRGI